MYTYVGKGKENTAEVEFRQKHSMVRACATLCNYEYGTVYIYLGFLDPYYLQTFWVVMRCGAEPQIFRFESVSNTKNFELH